MVGRTSRLTATLTACAVCWLLRTATAEATWRFTDVTTEAGVAYEHGYLPGAAVGEPAEVAGGVAAGDYDGDGWTDLYVVHGESGHNLLFRNRGDGTFEERSQFAGVALSPRRGSGPLFADLDGDGWLDLFVGGVDGVPISVFRNQRNGTFADMTEISGILTESARYTYGATAADWDRDGDLDLFLAHWQSSFYTIPFVSSQHLWRNDGGVFTDITFDAGLIPADGEDAMESFAARFADIDNDGWPDMLVAADFGTSKVFRNLSGNGFADVTDRSVITDGNGMGNAVGDYDGDGDFDWFVSSIWDPNGVAEGNWDVSGNRLYRNRGDGSFEDATDAAGVRVGYWGWASTFQDFNNDGHLDLFHVNGYGDVSIPETAEFLADPARLFVGNGDGTFIERSAEMGVADTGEGRGTVAFDYDRDGDLDIFIANNGGPSRLFRNDGLVPQSVTVRLRQAGANFEAIGARVDAYVNGRLQRRLVEGGSNYLSQDPAEVHFGLGDATHIDRLEVLWPDGETSSVGPIIAGSRITVRPRAAPPALCSAPAPENPCSPGGVTRADCLIETHLVGATRDRRTQLPSTTAACHEGDAACDLDPDVRNGECQFAVTVCIDNRDPRRRACEVGATALTLDQPSAAASDPVDQFNRMQLETVLGQFDLPTIGAVPPVFSNGQPDFCTTPATLRVPLRGDANRWRKGYRRIVLRATGRAGALDRDVIRLVCLPPAT